MLFRAIPKQLFANILSQTQFFTQYLLAPFGLPFGVEQACGGAEKAFELFSAEYHQWEEIVTRLLYLSRGIPGMYAFIF